MNKIETRWMKHGLAGMTASAVLLSAIAYTVPHLAQAQRNIAAPALQATATPTPRDTLSAFRLTSTTYLKIEVALKHRPNGDPLSPKIAKGQTVALMGKAADEKNNWWYRVVWSNKDGDYVGWIDANTTDFPPDKLAPLRPPPPCAKFLTSVPGARKWTNPKEQDLVVLADLYRRSPSGNYPTAKFKVTVNTEQKDRWSRPIKPTKGQFLLGRGTAINMGPIKANSVIGYALETTVQEPIMLFSAIFAVPDGCEFQSNN